MKQLMFKSLTQPHISNFALQRPLSIFANQQVCSYKTVVKRIINSDFENERREFKEKYKVLRKQHKKEYWEVQTQVENTYLDNWRQEQMAKQRRDLDRWRTTICNISMHTKKQIQDLEANERKLLDRMIKKDRDDTKKAMETKLMLDVMQIESRKWPTLNDLNTKVDENVVLPQTILNYGEYQQKLQNLAFFAEQGDHESMQKLLDKEDVMEKKNVLLQPIYRDLKSAIKHMTYTEEYKILKEYIDSRQQILLNYPEESSQAKEGLKLLEQEYAKLLRNHKKQLASPTKKLKILQKRLEDMFQLLNLWTQYVEIIYMPESEVHVISALEKMEGRPEDASYGVKLQEQDIQRRIDTLFGVSQEKIQHDDPLAPEKEEYETVNEGMTTDTTDAAAKQAKRPSILGEETKEDKRAEEKDVEEGILSSDDENGTQAKSKSKTKAKQDDNIKSFNQLRKDADKQKGLYESTKGKEDIENRYNYAEQDIENFGAKMQSLAEKNAENLFAPEGEEEKKDYVKQTQYKQEDLEKMDMASLNLFGIPIAETKDQIKDIASSKETQQVLRDLIDITEQLDENIMNFNMRKSFVYYDPYDPEESVTYAYLKYEDQTKLRASIVLDFYKQELTSFKDENLTYADKERKKQVLNLLEYLGQLKIVDASILMKIYDLYRYKI